MGMGNLEFRILNGEGFGCASRLFFACGARRQECPRPFGRRGC